MLKFSQFLCILIVFSLACNTVTPIPSSPDSQSLTQPAQGDQESISSAPPNQNTPIVILNTGNPEFALTALFEKGETLIAMTETDATGVIVDVTGAIFIAPDGRSIAIYFENGLPVRAIAEGHVIEFYNFTDSTVDVAIVAPDGTVTTQAGIPFDAQKIYKVNKSTMNNPGGGHLAALSLITQNEEIDWMQFASTALGAFSCAATIASGGTLSILFGVGCAFFVYTTYFQATEQEIPVLVEGGDSAVSAVTCGMELAEKNVMAIPDCGKLVIDAAKSIQESSSQTYEKQKRVVEEIKLNSSRSPSNDTVSCANLTPEECVNMGKHYYYRETTVQGKSCYEMPGPGILQTTLTFSDSSVLIDNFSGDAVSFNKTGANSYATVVSGISGYGDSTLDLKLSFNLNGFVIEERQITRLGPWQCILTNTFTFKNP